MNASELGLKVDFLEFHNFFGVIAKNQATILKIDFLQSFNGRRPFPNGESISEFVRLSLSRRDAKTTSVWRFTLLCRASGPGFR